MRMEIFILNLPKIFGKTVMTCGLNCYQMKKSVLGLNFVS